jgi:hypothetical protein
MATNAADSRKVLDSTGFGTDAQGDLGLSTSWPRASQPGPYAVNMSSATRPPKTTCASSTPTKRSVMNV